MTPDTFIQYAISDGLCDEEIYTIRRMIERVRFEFEDDYYAEAGRERREAQAGETGFSREDLEKAAPYLMKAELLYFEPDPDEEQPVRDLRPLQFLSGLRELAISGNEVSELSPLRELRRLRKLSLDCNPVADLSALKDCQELEKLDVSGLPAGDWSGLESLPKLKDLTVSQDGIATFKRIEELPALEYLTVGGTESLDSFEGWPAMPQLRCLWGATMASLAGLERYAALENLVNLSGEFDSLEPLRECAGLTHINIGSSRVRSLEALRGLTKLRGLWVGSSEEVEDVSVLRGLPLLHKVTVKCGGQEHAGLEALRAELSLWDTEFLNEGGERRCKPSLRLEAVDQATFDYYDTEQLYGLRDEERNKQMLESEREWLDGHLERVLSERAGLKEDEDYTLPWRWPGGRSRTLYLSSRRGIRRLNKVVRGVQEVLCRAKNDWIIYLELDSLESEVDFVAWIYPDKIVTAEKNERRMGRLLTPAGGILQAMKRPFRAKRKQ